MYYMYLRNKESITNEYEKLTQFLFIPLSNSSTTMWKMDRDVLIFSNARSTVQIFCWTSRTKTTIKLLKCKKYMYYIDNWIINFSVVQCLLFPIQLAYQKPIRKQARPHTELNISNCTAALRTLHWTLSPIRARLTALFQNTGTVRSPFFNVTLNSYTLHAVQL